MHDRIGGGYRHHVRGAVAASAAPYGYTLTLWTAGAVTSHAQGLPSALDAMLLLVGAVAAFGLVGSFAFGGINHALDAGERRPIRVWGGMHLLSVGASIALVDLTTHVLSGTMAWPVVGFVATATYLLLVGLQFWAASRFSSD